MLDAVETFKQRWLGGTKHRERWLQTSLVTNVVANVRVLGHACVGRTMLGLCWGAFPKQRRRLALNHRCTT